FARTSGTWTVSAEPGSPRRCSASVRMAGSSSPDKAVTGTASSGSRESPSSSTGASHGDRYASASSSRMEASAHCRSSRTAAIGPARVASSITRRAACTTSRSLRAGDDLREHRQAPAVPERGAAADEEPIRGQRVAELLREAALPDARLAGNDHHPRAPFLLGQLELSTEQPQE